MVSLEKQTSVCIDQLRKKNLWLLNGPVTGAQGSLQRRLQIKSRNTLEKCRKYP